MSINIMMFVIANLFLLVILKDSSGHEIKGCSPDSPMEVNAATNNFQCVGIRPGQHVLWYVKTQNPHNRHVFRIINVAECTPQPTPCRTHLTNIHAVRQNSTSSSLQFSQDMSFFSSIGCKVYRNVEGGSEDVSDYTCNLISRGHEIEGCSPDSPMEVNEASNNFQCVGIRPGQHVLWYVKTQDPHNPHVFRIFNVAECTPRPCRTHLTNVHADRHNSTSSSLEMFSKDMSSYSSIGCMVYSNVQGASDYMNDYTCNLILRDVPSFICTLQQQQDSSTTAVCFVLNIQILRRSYKCEFKVTFQDGREEIIRGWIFAMWMQDQGMARGVCFVHNLQSREQIRKVEGILLPDNLHAIANFQS